ncbi:MAG: potassium/proton antiporter [Alphaproteobacteria bacterium]|nr:potassium/proton antiporter [Alphaproteobacteria bacterium]
MTLEVLMAIGGALLLMCVFANKISSRLGIPSLLVFLTVGMIAGSDGAGIQFYSAKLSNYIGSFALAFILFAGGLETNWSSVKSVLVRGTVLATAGVALTAAIMVGLSYYLLGLPFPMALLLGVILSSTDAPAVFNILRTNGLYLNNPKLKSLLEYESGSNDPMAVILSVGAITFLTASDKFSLIELSTMLCLQMGLGVVMGYGLGVCALAVLNKFSFVYRGLYPVFGVSVVCLVFSVTQLVGGSGYLAIYIAGLVLGNASYPYKNPFIQFQSALSWVMQILMFLTLGLFVNPKELGDVAGMALSATVCLVMIARPLAVFLCLMKSGYSRSEKLFVSWAGLKGAVPIILATYPLMAGIEDAQHLFNLIFFLVIISVLVQGQTLASFARFLELSHDTPTPEELKDMGGTIGAPTGKQDMPQIYVSFKSYMLRITMDAIKTVFHAVDWHIRSGEEELKPVSGLWNRIKRQIYIRLKQLHAYCLEEDLAEAKKKAEETLKQNQAGKDKDRFDPMFIRLRHFDDDK